MAQSEIRQIGWDIGGAHVKVAALDASGRLVAALQVPCQLWRSVDRLDLALDEALAALPAAPEASHAATMTGELADVFSDRPEGVRCIVAALQRRKPVRLQVYAGDNGFLDPQQAAADPDSVASANWLATASVVAGRTREALLVDIGSTTTDLVAIHCGHVAAVGRNDFERLVVGELVYSGIVRTPLMAVTDTIEFEGSRVALMAEHFATTADVYRLTGELDERYDQHASADGAEKTPQASARRIARMVGRDARERPLADWCALAASFRAAQLERIRRAALQVLSHAAVDPGGMLVCAGSGAFLVPELARALARDHIGFADLIGCPPGAADPGVCAPAIAVAMLAQHA
ncbi:MAG: H4MPT-linked C1 transfer pathway protein [Burkholderiaceae bacterium]|nr:H4MPT-linked C1 transfer pathway protein [Burkholderiaceae bacterium]